MENKSFVDLYNKNVKEFTEKKGKYLYLSWSYAVKELKIAYPESTYIQVYNENKPYFKDESGCYVKINLFLTKQDRKDDFYQPFTHPILDNHNNPILKPDSFDVNTSFMRGLTKLIGMCTGIGLSLYSGEDLPDLERDEKKRIAMEKLEVEKLERERIALERKEQERIALEKKEAEIKRLEDEKIEAKKIDFLNKIRKTLGELKNSGASLTKYHEYIKVNLTDKHDWLAKNDRFISIVELFTPEPEIIINKAVQTINKIDTNNQSCMDKCDKCFMTDSYCTCDITPVLAKA